MRHALPGRPGRRRRREPLEKYTADNVLVILEIMDKEELRNVDHEAAPASTPPRLRRQPRDACVVERGGYEAVVASRREVAERVVREEEQLSVRQRERRAHREFALRRAGEHARRDGQPLDLRD